MTALYELTRLLTFPGAYVRCFWEQIVCRICGIPVEDNRYLRGDELSGHIDHELAPTASSAFAICFVPAFFNAIGALMLAVLPVAYVFVYETTDVLLTLLCAVSYWLACSLYINSYSLIEDAKNMMVKIFVEGNIFQKIIYAPGFVFLYIGSYLERYNVTFLSTLIATVVLVIVL